MLHPLKPLNRLDSVNWRWTSNQLFTVKSLYLFLTDAGCRDPTSQSIWKLKTPSKIKIFVWLLLRNRLLTNDRLRTPTGPEEETCVLWASASESRDHLFSNCVFVKYLLFNVAGPELLADPQIEARELIRLLSQGNVKTRSKGLSFCLQYGGWYGLSKITLSSYHHPPTLCAR